MQKNKIQTGVIYAIKTGYILSRSVVVRLPYVGERYRYTDRSTEFIRCDDSHTPAAAQYSGDLSIGYLVVKALHASFTDAELLMYADKLDAIVASHSSSEYFQLPRYDKAHVTVVQSRAILQTWQDHLDAERDKQRRQEEARSAEDARILANQETEQRLIALASLVGIALPLVDTYRRQVTFDLKACEQLLALAAKGKEQAR